MAILVSSNDKQLTQQILPSEMEDVIETVSTALNEDKTDDSETTIFLSSTQNEILSGQTAYLETVFHGLCDWQGEETSRDVSAALYMIGLLLAYSYREQYNSTVQAEEIAGRVKKTELLLNHKFQGYQLHPIAACVRLKGAGLESEASSFLLLETQLTPEERSEQLQQRIKAKFKEVWAKYFAIRNYRTIHFIWTNWLRLYILRIGRLADSAAAIPFLHPLFNWLAVGYKVFSKAVCYAVIGVLFYLPRLLINLAMIIKHTFLISYMTEAQLDLPWQQRLSMQLRRRDFQLMNDGMWFGINLVGFIVTKALNLFLTAALYFYDNLVELNELRKTYNLNQTIGDRLGQVSADASEGMIASIQGSCQKRMRQRQFALTTTTLLSIGMIPLGIKGILAMTGTVSLLGTCPPVLLAALLAGAIFVFAVTTYQMYKKKDYAATSCDLTAKSTDSIEIEEPETVSASQLRVDTSELCEGELRELFEETKGTEHVMIPNGCRTPNSAETVPRGGLFSPVPSEGRMTPSPQKLSSFVTGYFHRSLSPTCEEDPSSVSGSGHATPEPLNPVIPAKAGI